MAGDHRAGRRRSAGPGDSVPAELRQGRGADGRVRCEPRGDPLDPRRRLAGRPGRDPPVSGKARRGVRGRQRLEAGRGTDPWHKVGPSRVFNALVSTLTGCKLHDHNCGFKAYRRAVVEEVHLLRRTPSIRPSPGPSPEDSELPRSRSTTAPASLATRSTGWPGLSRGSWI